MTPALVIFKPDAAHRAAVRVAIWEWLDRRDDLRFQSMHWYQAPPDLIEQHYDFLKERPFFPWLVDFMTALPVIVGKVEVEDLDKLRHDLGETQIAKARPGSIRERYGIYGGINCLHLSDSPETGLRELEIWEEYVDLEHGISADKLDDRDGLREHTYQLRSLATQYAAGLHKELAGEVIKGLLREETDIDDYRFQAFVRIILGALEA